MKLFYPQQATSIVRVFDPLHPSSVSVAIDCGHENYKLQFVTWVDPTRLLTAGLNERT